MILGNISNPEAKGKGSKRAGWTRTEEKIVWRRIGGWFWKDKKYSWNIDWDEEWDWTRVWGRNYWRSNR